MAAAVLVMSVIAAMWSQSMPCRTPSASAAARMPASSAVAKAASTVGDERNASAGNNGSMAGLPLVPGQLAPAVSAEAEDSEVVHIGPEAGRLRDIGAQLVQVLVVDLCYVVALAADQVVVTLRRHPLERGVPAAHVGLGDEAHVLQHGQR